MEPTHWQYLQYLGALGGVIGIGWLVVVPMYRGWTRLNEEMTGGVRRSIRMVAECRSTESFELSGFQSPAAAAQAGTMAGPSAKRTSAPSTETS
jgi:hypothetical protein